ncbi:MAG: addiction module protein [Planctomycetaceae bacterium]|nr:addiction module protein [Planctomycetaceae bacterium]
MTNREQVLERALNLSSEDRRFLIGRLQKSLDESNHSTDEVRAAWSNEVDRRLDAYDRGEVPAVDAEIAMREMRRQLEERRTGASRPSVTFTEAV